jgi:O-antigen/teichoic acid export membrane protein
VGIVIKQSAYASAINYVGVIIGAINLIFLFPAFFETQQIGLYKAIFSMATILAPFAEVGLARSTLRYFSRFNKSAKTRGRFLSLILILGALSITIFILLFQLVDQWVFSFFEENAPELRDHYWAIIVLVGLFTYLSIFEAYYKALLNVVIPTLMKEFFLRIVVSLLVSLYFLDYISFGSFINYSILSYALSLTILIIYLLHKKQLHFNFSIFQIEKSFLKHLLKYMFFIMAGSIGSVIVLGIDQLMVTSYLGLGSNAIYFIAFYMASVIEIPKRAISQMSDSVIATAFEFERMDEIKIIYKQSSINQLILGSFVYLLVVSNLDNIYDIMPSGETYESGKWVVILIGLGKIMDMGFGVNSEIIISSKLYRTNIVFVIILAFFTIFLNAAFIPIYGLEGAALATLISLFIFNFIKMLFIWNRFKFQPFSKGTLTSLLISAITLLVAYFLPTLENVYLNTLMITIVLSLVFGVLIIALKPSKEINKILVHLKKRFIA